MLNNIDSINVFCKTIRNLLCTVKMKCECILLSDWADVSLKVMTNLQQPIASPVECWDDGGMNVTTVKTLQEDRERNTTSIIWHTVCDTYIYLSASNALTSMPWTFSFMWSSLVVFPSFLFFQQYPSFLYLTFLRLYKIMAPFCGLTTNKQTKIAFILWQPSLSSDAHTWPEVNFRSVFGYNHLFYNSFIVTFYCIWIILN